jgi:hypothetical protein
MRIFVSLILAALAVVGCKNPSTAPENALIGQWGGGGVELIANARDVQVAAPCFAHLTARGPIIPYQGNRFILSLEMNRAESGPSSQSTGAHALSGTIAGDRITVELTSITIGGNFKNTYELVRDEPQGYQLNCDY